jgi:hypothetical protein
MGFVNGANLLPSTGEFTYATTERQGTRNTSNPALPFVTINNYANQPSHRTDYALSIDQLQAAFPACTTVAVVCAWFGNNETASFCQIYPSTTYINSGVPLLSKMEWLRIFRRKLALLFAHASIARPHSDLVERRLLHLRRYANQSSSASSI